MLKDLVKRGLYSSGLLGLYHRVRNADTLTVVMFHRVLDERDPRWAVCDPDYTLPVPVFEAALEVLQRHYNIVSLDQVRQARQGRALPARALLLTFDDGWADNADYALPVLRRAGLPAVMFVVAGAVGRRQPFFQEQLVSAYRRGRLPLERLAAALGAPAGNGHGVPGLGVLRGLIDRLEQLGPSERMDALAEFDGCLDDGLRHMADEDELRALGLGGVALGLHGMTHAPITRAVDPGTELEGARLALESRLEGRAEVVPVMSFPYGEHDQALAERARAGGYELVFTSVPVLNDTQRAPSWLLGRTGFETATVVDRRGRFRPDWLALYLFRKPKAGAA